MFSVFARKKHNDHNESQPVIPPGWRAGSPELIHTPLRYPIDHNENQSSHPQNLELFRGHEAYYAILRWCYQKNNCIFGLPDPQNIGLAIFVFALNGSYLKDRKHRPETCMISQPTAQCKPQSLFLGADRWFLGILSAFLVINDLNSHQGNIRSADPKIESILNRSDFWSFYGPIFVIFMRFSLVLTNKTWQTHFSSELNK